MATVTFIYTTAWCVRHQQLNYKKGFDSINLAFPIAPHLKYRGKSWLVGNRVVSRSKKHQHQPASLVSVLALGLDQQASLVSVLALGMHQQVSLVSTLALGLHQQVSLVSALALGLYQQVSLVSALALGLHQQVSLVSALAYFSILDQASQHKCIFHPV